jgi:alpha-1,4-digalacturonate transport system permease protein
MRIIEIPMLALQRLLGINKLRLGVSGAEPPSVRPLRLSAGHPERLLRHHWRRQCAAGRSARCRGSEFRHAHRLRSFLDPNSCREDKFWRAVWNTTWFVTLQVGIMVGFSLLTAVILNRDIRARGFFRSCSSFPCFCRRLWSR